MAAFVPGASVSASGCGSFSSEDPYEDFSVGTSDDDSGRSSHRAADADTAAVMRQKLATSQRILGGLAVADFGLIQTNAASLITLSGQRGWMAMQTPDYELFFNPVPGVR